MSAGDVGHRPSLPHAMTRVRTDRASAVPEEAPTVREPARMLSIPFDEIPEGAKRFADAIGMTIEDFVAMFGIGTKGAVIATRQDDQLRVKLDEGKIIEKLDSMIESRTFRARFRRSVVIGGLLGGWTAAIVLAIYTWARGAAHADAAEVIVAPAVAAEAKVLTLEERIAQTEKRHDDTEQTLSDLRASVERLNGAVVALAGKLEEPARLEVRKP